MHCYPGATTNVQMRPVLLVILDGWGNSARREGNAIELQGTPNLDELAALIDAAKRAAKR